MKKNAALNTVGLVFVLLAGCGGSGGGTGSGGGGSLAGQRITIADTASGRPRIWVHDLTSGSFLIQAESAAARNEMPALSPDASKVAFISNRSGSDELYVMTVNQPASLQRLTTDSVADASPAWASNSRLVWSKSVSGTDSEIVAMNLDGSGYAQLTNNDVDDRLPAVSRDGSTLAFIRPEGGRSHVIYKMPASGGAAVLVQRHSTDKPSVSWLGSSFLYFTALDGGVESCMRVSSAGGAPSKITEGWGPRASADGARIMFARLAEGKPQIFTSTSTGGDLKQYSYVAEAAVAWDWRG